MRCSAGHPARPNPTGTTAHGPRRERPGRTEEIVLNMAREAHRLTGKKNLVLAGGVALNCVANGQVLREGPFADCGFNRRPAMPAARWARRCLSGINCWKIRASPPGATRNRGVCWAPHSPTRKSRAHSPPKIPHQKFTDEAGLLEAVAGLLAAGKVVGWFQGRMEFGPRALGSRSILGDPRNPALQSVMNLKIKQRESFRPFAPCVLTERAAEYFALPAGTESPYMLLVAPVLEKHRMPISHPDWKTMTDRPRPAPACRYRSLHTAGDHACGLQRARPDRGRGAARTVLPAAQDV